MSRRYSARALGQQKTHPIPSVPWHGRETGHNILWMENLTWASRTAAILYVGADSG